VLVAGILALIGLVTGPILGFALIFLNLSPVLVNVIGSLIFALLIPYVALGRTLLYLDLCARDEKAGEPARRRRWRSRLRPAAETS
jgi:hypothetical protein